MGLTTGTKLGPYEIVSLLGSGGMGEVYRARDSRLGRDVAIKILPPAFAQDAERLRRFEQEARVVGALNHPNILAIYDIGDHNGSRYLVSELLEGEPLRKHVEASALPQRKAIDYGIQIARGLAAAHDKGVVHRDLKPDNIFVLHDGRLKILDFGLAKLTRDEALAGSPEQTVDQAHDTLPGQVLGTVGYMAPEQVRGQAADNRTDIFAFGTILYEMLTGKRAFKRDSSVETLNAILKEDPAELHESLPNVAPGLDRVVHHCLEKNPAQRFQSASDIAFDLEMISSQSGTSTRLRAVKDERRFHWKQAVGAIAIGLALAATYYAARRTAPALTPHFHQLTFQRGSIYGAKFAPDGESIVYSAAWNGAPKPQVYATRTDALMSRPIDLLDSTVLGISSKGELALAQKSTTGTIPRGMLAVAPLTGGAPRELLGDVSQAAWSHDGESLAAVHFVGPECRLEYPIGKTIYSTRTGHFSDVALSPDDKHIAFFDHPIAGDTRGYVAIVDLSGNASRLTKEWADLTGLAWSRSGDEIWFTGSDSGINSALYAVSLKGQLRDLLHIPGRLHLFDISKEGEVLLSNEATRIEAYGHHMGQDRDIDMSWFDWTLVRGLSADGQWAVLEEDGEGGGPDYTVFLRKTDGSPAIRMGTGLGTDISPDDKWVSSTSVKQPAPTVLLPAGAGQPLTLGDGQLFHTAVMHFLPNGNGLLEIASEPGKARRTYTVMLDGSAPKPFGPEGFYGTVISPDGRFVAGRKGDVHGLVAFANDQTLEPLPTIPAEQSIIGWTADSKSVYAAETSSNTATVYIVDVKTGQRRLHHQHAPADFAGVSFMSPGRVSPDGNYYVYVVGRVLSYLYVVEGLK
jgi:eukaryotic-like serine/threonine-protein kinase